MRSKRSNEGYLLIDHSMSPGTAEVPEGRRFEAAVLVCGHCQRGMLRNPERTRDRFHCRKCDKYVCDFCGDPLITGCRNYVAMLDEMQEQAFRKLNIREL